MMNAYASLGDDWSSIKASLKNAEKAPNLDEALNHLENAKSIYEDKFRNSALVSDVESNSLIENAFSDTEIRLQNGDIHQATLNRQIIDKTIYKIAFLEINEALEKNNAKQFLEWFDVMNKKFKISEKDFVTNQAILEIQQSPDEISEYSSIIKDELLGIFKLKTLEEIEEAIEALEQDNINDAQILTHEGFYYYRTFHPSVEEKLGVEKANELLHEMQEAIDITTSDISANKMKEKLERITTKVELIIREYEGGDVSEIGLAISGIKDRLNLVEAEYLDAVKNEIIVDQQEYDETLIFLNKAIEIFEENQDGFMSLSPNDASSLQTQLQEIKSMVDSMQDQSKIQNLVNKSLTNLENFETLVGGSAEITTLEYIDEINRLLVQVKEVYHNGDSNLAYDLATEAYLDNYEFVEGPLGELDPELMKKIELEMREDLRKMIRTNASPDEIDTHIDTILDDLQIARAVVPEFGVLSFLVLAVAVGSVMLIGIKSRRFGILPN